MFKEKLSKFHVHFVLLILSSCLMFTFANCAGTSGSNDHIEAIIDDAVRNGKSVCITYKNKDGVRSERTISKIEYTKVYGKDGYIKAYCHLRNDYRTFKISRIQSVKR